MTGNSHRARPLAYHVLSSVCIFIMLRTGRLRRILHDIIEHAFGLDLLHFILHFYLMCLTMLYAEPGERCIVRLRQQFVLSFFYQIRSGPDFFLPFGVFPLIVEAPIVPANLDGELAEEWSLRLNNIVINFIFVGGRDFLFIDCNALSDRKLRVSFSIPMLGNHYLR